MATLAEALSANLAPRKRCQFRDWRATFTPEEESLLIGAFESEMSDAELSRRLINAGCPVANHRIIDHRRNCCKACK